MINKKRFEGFTLPTVLIASLVLLGLLSSALLLSTSASNALKEQYYSQLAREAAEAGAARLAHCIRRDYFDTTKTVRPNTNCLGGVVAAPDHILKGPNYTTTFEAKYVSSGLARVTESVGMINLRRKDGSIYKTYSYVSRQQVSQEVDPSGSRASKRWWYFGNNARVDFGTGGATVSPSLSVPSRPISHEGITTVSGRDGNLKFISDGLNIWDKNGNVMPIRAGAANFNPNCDYPTGTPFPFSPLGQGLCGSVTGTQAVASFPINREETRFIVVSNTVNANDVKNYGTLYWSLIDFAVPGYPDGVITLKNAAVAPGGMKRYASEALNARPNAVGNGGIIYTYRPNAPNALYAFGIWTLNNGSNIISGQHPNMSGNTKPIQFAYKEFTPANGRSVMCGSDADAFKTTSFGSINFNDSYTKLVVMMGGSDRCPRERRAGSIQVFDISAGDNDMRQMNYWSVNNGSEIRGAGYAADFSPTSRYVYTSSIYPGRLFRYDLSSGNNTTIKNSERFIGKTNCAERPGTGIAGGSCQATSYHPLEEGGGQVLRGPDGKMYVADRSAPWISVVDHPDASSGATSAQTAVNVGWRHGGLPLPGGALSYYGLPQMVSLYTPRFIQY